MRVVFVVVLAGALCGAAAFAVQTPDQDAERQTRATCGGCHAFPPPDILPRDRWREEVVRMLFIRENRLSPIGPPERVYNSVQLPPDLTQALAFYTARAPERLPAPESWPYSTWG